jgi:hypothetical protein
VQRKPRFSKCFITLCVVGSAFTTLFFDFFVFYYKVLLFGIFSVHSPGYKNDLNCSFNQFTWVVTHPVRVLRGLTC